MDFQYPLDMLWYLYIFKRRVPITVGPVEDRDRFYVYARDQIEAFTKYADSHVDEVKKGLEPIFLGRDRS